ncbi:hypothetical protein CBF90_14310 [Microbacterium sp. AISO3]|uniref:hypothetical protein n=1 Tax=Microbacterium sp. AISO3 TaxID=2002831 RepID=UPI000B4D5504|nr:hypothetical protein [Microbacterium sp. AISO3]OWP20240.1 hypothetical protein CBF90_17845 [Microbacterium sp. AISO3]OWP20888.1 hypothetical protein CBF90_14310 [Microbacterium sp. AISO3]
MNSLADLFTDDRRSGDDGIRAADSIIDERRLAALVGPPRMEQAVPLARPDETGQLVAMVAAAAQSASPVHIAGKSGAPKMPRRGHKRTDWLNVAFAVLAVAVVTVVGVFGAIQFANASPAASALRALSVDEASLANGEQAVQSGVTRIETLMAEARAEADGVEPALATVAGYVDESARAAAVQAVADLRAGLDAIEVPSTPAAYTRPAIDTDDLAQVGAQIDVVRERSDELTAMTEQTRAVRSQVVALRDAFVGSIAALGASFPASAEAEVTEYAEALPSFRDAVTAAAAAVPAAQAAGGLGAAEMVAYPPLVDALHRDHERAIAAIIAEREAARNTTGRGSTSPGTGSGNSDTGGTVTPEPTPSDPATGGDTGGGDTGGDGSGTGDGSSGGDGTGGDTGGDGTLPGGAVILP